MMALTEMPLPVVQLLSYQLEQEEFETLVDLRVELYGKDILRACGTLRGWENHDGVD
jgi:hypothetical protein